jgi:putative transposase
MTIPIIYLDEVAETITVKRTQRIHLQYNETISYYCHISKNIWNQAHRIIHGYYKKHGQMSSYEELDAILNKKYYSGYKKNGKYNPDFDNYHKLGATAQQILRVYFKSWISYFKAKKDYFANPDKDYTGMPTWIQKERWRIRINIYK